MLFEPDSAGLQRTLDSGSNLAERASTHSSRPGGPRSWYRRPTGDVNQSSHIEVDASTAQPSRTSKVIDQFNQAFLRHDGSLLENLSAEDCVMESVEPAPDGTGVVGRAAKYPLALSLRSRALAIRPWSHPDASARWADRGSARLREDRRRHGKHGCA